jgi:hypothetical protein
MILKLPAVTISAFGRKVGRRLDPKGGGFSAEMAVAFGAGVASPQGGCWGQGFLSLPQFAGTSSSATSRNLKRLPLVASLNYALDS